MARVLRPLSCIALLFALQAVVSARVHGVYTGGQWETAHATVYGSGHASGTMAPNGLASGEASKSSPLQFGSTTLGFKNGIQVVKSELWHQATQFSKSKLSPPPLILAMIGVSIFIIFIIFCLCWMCTHGHPQEEAGPEPELELAVVEPAGVGPTAVVGLDPTVISLFPLLPFMSDGPVEFRGSECQICLEQFVHGENVRVLPTCRHIFHDLCIKAWLTSRTECAVYRHEYLGWEPEMLAT